ncbi:hypothetical protein I316_06722 [Kwoniella heveanensis BCC8398]|uniref:Uncharacterized protein n=1 Tax=Kwoniella heveanensis BCC8398 TaxID=1296120 RepID=A0A1B9GKP3_9TREE|nr:hypothetical protein I316_06722 [Kwoniella heveanensis BCC8398]
MNEAGPSGFGSTMPPLTSTSNTASLSVPIESQTFQSAFHDLLLSSNSKNLSLTHLHPFASQSNELGLEGLVSGKGKGRIRQDGDESERLRSLRHSLSKTRQLLSAHQLASGQTGDIADAGRLVRGLREVTTHQSVLLNSSTPLLIPSTSPTGAFSQAQSPSSTQASLFASPLQLLSPITLLQSLSTSLGLQAFIEDSQFGLLKSSLAIAGNRVVVDVDLETDTPVGGEDEDVEDDVQAGSTSTPLPSAALSSSKEADKERGKVRLSKLVANHVTASGGTGKSEAITNILKLQIEKYLQLWNGHPASTDQDQAGLANRWEMVHEKEECLQGLRNVLAELKVIDDLAEQGGALDMFELVESGIENFEKLKSGQGNVRVYPAAQTTIFPTFQLLPSSPSTTTPDINNRSSSSFNRLFRIRPARANEEVSTPFSDHSIADSGLGDGGDRDQSMDERWTDGDWVLEVVNDSLGAEPWTRAGLIIRRNWLSGEDDGALSEGIRVENVLYHPFGPTGYLPPQAQPFPYTSTFVHTSPFISSADALETTAVRREQHWSIAQPGPQAFVLDKVGVPRSVDGLTKLIKALRRQVVLNSFFTEVFVASHLKAETLDVEDEDESIDDLLDGPQKTIPVAAILHQSSMDVSIPLLDSKGASKNVQLVLRYDDDAHAEGYVKVDLDGGASQVSGGSVEEVIKSRADRSLVSLVEEVIAASTSP